jgi:hypothetical protein
MGLRSFAGLAVLFIAVGCGGSESPPAASNPPPLVPPDTIPIEDAGVVDAGPDPHDIYPASHPPIPVIKNNGGRVLKDPKLVTITFEGMSTTQRDTLRDFDAKILKTPYWTTVMDGYGVNAGSGDEFREFPDTLSNKTTTDDELQTWLATQITTGTVPTPTSDTIYMLYMPPKAIIDLVGDQSCSTFGGYHYSGAVTLDGKPQRFIYAVMADCLGNIPAAGPQDILDSLTSTATHEIAEAVTDPDVNVTGLKPTYYMEGNDAWAPDLRGGEVGDLCPRPTREGSWVVSRIWNAAAAKASKEPCVPDADGIFYGAAPHTENPSKKLGGAPNGDGYVVVKKGTSVNVEVDVFSTGPLPSPLTILAGNGSSRDPFKINAITKGVTTTLSAPTGRNGDKLTMTIKADSTVASGVYRFSVRSVLSADSYNRWPVVLYVP